MLVELVGANVKSTSPSVVTAAVTSRLTQLPLVTGYAVERIGPTASGSKVENVSPVSDQSGSVYEATAIDLLFDRANTRSVARVTDAPPMPLTGNSVTVRTSGEPSTYNDIDLPKLVPGDADDTYVSAVVVNVSVCSAAEPFIIPRTSVYIKRTCRAINTIA